MKIATWNVNSIRTRLDHVVGWLRDNPVEVLCLQETKVVDADFPRSPLEALGYHLYVSGQKSYNGVAILSRTLLETIDVGFAAILGDAAVGDLDDQKRVISGVVDGIRVVNLYVPNGSSVGSEKYEYKLRWLTLLKRYLETLLTDSTLELCVCGDFNIAPDDRDLHDPEKLKNHIMASDVERTALEDIAALGLSDAFRKFTDEPGHYSWWDYRAASFRRNLGWRIDHHYVSAPLYQKAKSCVIDVEPRKLEKPSDHVPVVLDV